MINSAKCAYVCAHNRVQGRRAVGARRQRIAMAAYRLSLNGPLPPSARVRKSMARCASSRHWITDNETVRGRRLGLSARPRTPYRALCAPRPRSGLGPAPFFSDRFIGRPSFVKCQIDGHCGDGQVSAPPPHLADVSLPHRRARSRMGLQRRAPARERRALSSNPL